MAFKRLTLFIIIMYDIFNVILGDQCAIGALLREDNGAFGPRIVVYNLDEKTIINWSTEPNGISEHYNSIAVDHRNDILYAAQVGGDIWTYDITTQLPSFLGNTSPNLNGLVYNDNDGYLYGIRSSSICQISVTAPISTDCDYGTILTSGRGLMISKDGNYFYYVDYGVSIRRAPFNNPTGGTTESVLDITNIINNLGCVFAESIAWLNDDPNDNRVILGCDNDVQTYSIISIDIVTEANELIRTDTHPIGFNWVTGIEPLYQDYDDCNELVPSSLTNVCPCYMNINTTIKYDTFECCDVGILISSCDNPMIEYGLKENDKSCYIRENGIITIQYGSLSDELYYKCESELLPIINKYGANIAKTDINSINKFKKYFSFIIDGKEVVSPYLIVCGIIFIIFILAFIGLIGYCLYTCIHKTYQSKHESYHHLNATSDIITSDTNTEI